MTDARVGRPPIEINEALCKEAELLASHGLTIKQIALSLGIGESTVYEKKARFPEFSEAITRGQAAGIQAVSNALFEKAMSGDFPSIRYFLNNRDPDNWGDRKEFRVEGGVTWLDHESRLELLR